MKDLKIINRKAKYDYFVEDTLECGISLKGNEVKSIFAGKCNLTDSWATIQNGQLVLRGMYISKWDTTNTFDHNELREKILLVHKKEIRTLAQKKALERITLIPLSLYTSNGKVKVELGICRGKKNYDKRNCLSQKDIKRDIERSLKER